MTGITHMTRTRRSHARTIIVTLAMLPASVAPAQNATEHPAGPMHPIDALLQQIEDLQSTVDALRNALAESKMEAAVWQRERDELRRFIQDHHELGRDFEQYHAFQAAARRDAQRQRVDEARSQHEARHAARTAQRQDYMARRAKRESEQHRVEEFRKAGFSPLGFEVYLSNAAFNYKTYTGTPARYDYNVLTGGHFVRVYPHHRANVIDFSSMTISGSVMNAAEEVRDIGIALTFFDEAGSQVGGEIIQVNNARPQVPYPFTVTIAMALDRPFDSTSTYVLYADPSAP